MSISAVNEGRVAPPLRELAGFFLKLGTIAFGGPAAHIAIMEDELVGRRKWIALEEFLDLLAVANLLPGPSSTELAIFIGYRLRGLVGLLLAGCCFILPAFILVSAIAWAYVRYGRFPAATGILYGIKPVVIAVVLHALWRLGKAAIKTSALLVIGIAALVASLLGVNPVCVLFGAALLAAILYGAKQRSVRIGTLPIGLKAMALPAGIAGAVTLSGIFLAFLKLGCMVFGSGYVLLAFLRADFVTSRHWLTESQLLDAVAVGQVTPGPVFTTATFIGYILAGPKGAVAATVGIFAPAFAFVAAAGPIVQRLRRSKIAGAMLDGLNAASVGLMAAVLWELAKAAVVDQTTLYIALASVIVLARVRLNSVWLIAGGAAVGIIAVLLFHPH